jgi:hypothetical protein
VNGDLVHFGPVSRARVLLLNTDTDPPNSEPGPSFPMIHKPLEVDNGLPSVAHGTPTVAFATRDSEKSHWFGIIRLPVQLHVAS